MKQMPHNLEFSPVWQIKEVTISKEVRECVYRN